MDDLSLADEMALLRGRVPDDGTLAARRERVRGILRRTEAPQGRDASLIALLADVGALPIATRDEHLRARQRLADVGRMADPPAPVLSVFAKRKLTPGDGTAFADALLPADRDVRSGWSTSNWAPSSGDPGGAASVF